MGIENEYITTFTEKQAQDIELHSKRIFSEDEGKVEGLGFSEDVLLILGGSYSDQKVKEIRRSLQAIFDHNDSIEFGNIFIKYLRDNEFYTIKGMNAM